MKRKKKLIRKAAPNGAGTPSSREDRITREIRLHLNALTRGGLSYELAEVHLRRARNFGLEPGETIRIGNERFQLVDNTSDDEPLVKKGAAWRPARFPRYEIREVKDVAAAVPAAKEAT
jgi:hypothetical protein